MVGAPATAETEAAISLKTTLHSGVRYLKGVGPRYAALLSKAGIETIEDLLYHVPRAYTDWSRISEIDRLRIGDRVTIVASVLSNDVVRRGRTQIFVAALEDDTGAIFARWFNQAYLKSVLKKSTRVVVSGEVRFDRFARRKEFINPAFEVFSSSEMAELVHAGRIVPEYSQIGELSGRRIRRFMKNAIDGFLDQLVDPLPSWVRAGRSLPDLRDAMGQVHFPATLDGARRARCRLAFEELFLFQVIVAVRKRRAAQPVDGATVAIGWDESEHERLVSSLPFALTEAQRRVTREIRSDVESPRSMNRLLEGDVGSGKTVVAAAAMHQAVACGYQAALMAPTEILAEQHHRNIASLLAPLGDRIALLKGGMKHQEREEALRMISSGEGQVVIGTHALIQEATRFARLGLVVIDEQHRFGVVQRAALRKKGRAPNVLVMTATPIPRTLALTVYGDLDVSVLDELPPGRTPVTTAVRSEASRGKVYKFLREQIASGRQVFVVYPLVEESEKIDLAAATKMYQELQADVFRDAKVGLVHGRMKPQDKDAAMQAFEAGETDVLVSTTVVEVGIDVPNATVMVIEHAERFGLAQLHQLRGRVGRGGHRSYCVLMVGDGVSEEARERIRVLEETTDGFVVAERDLELRGPGEFLGIRQHGLPEFSVADLRGDLTLLVEARADAFSLLERDPELSGPESDIVLRAISRRFRDREMLTDIG